MKLFHTHPIHHRRHRTHLLGKVPEPFEHRLAMCRLLVEDNPKIRVSDIEESINRPGYTIDLVQRLIRDFPTELRIAPARGESPVDAIPEKVFEYIRAYGPYQSVL